MLRIATSVFVFLGGFAVMVLEIVGARYLDRYFGGSFYVWISQIGVILMALSLGYAVGGALADRFRRARFLALPLAAAAVFTFFIPKLTPSWLNWIVMRHPPGDIPAVWIKLDPAIGSGLVFFLPCVVLAVVSPYMIRVAARNLEKVGTISGMIYSASTVGSIAGVFVSGYIFLDQFDISTIFRINSGIILALSFLSLQMDFGFGTVPGASSPAPPGRGPSAPSS